MLISVYLPTRNRAAQLAAAIESVRLQTHEHFELIVVDDGSTDDTGALLAAVAAQDARVRVITNTRSLGGPAARNLAILAARGDFVTGLDDDDTFAPARLERFANAWRRHERAGARLAGLYSHVAVMRHGQAVANTVKPDSASFEDMFRENVVGNQIFAPRRHYLEAGLFRVGLPAWQDLELFMRMLKVYGPARLDAAVTYQWDDTPRDDRVSLGSKERLRMAFDTVVALHAAGNPRRIQQLYLQLLGGYYGVRPTLQDWNRFLALGLWPRGILRLMRGCIGRNMPPRAWVRRTVEAGRAAWGHPPLRGR